MNQVSQIKLIKWSSVYQVILNKVEHITLIKSSWTNQVGLINLIRLGQVKLSCSDKVDQIKWILIKSSLTDILIKLSSKGKLFKLTLLINLIRSSYRNNFKHTMLIRLSLEDHVDYTELTRLKRGSTHKWNFP